MIESIADIAATDDSGPDINDADLADWIEQHQTTPLPDDDYPRQVPHRYRPTTKVTIRLKGRWHHNRDSRPAAPGCTADRPIQRRTPTPRAGSYTGDGQSGHITGLAHIDG